MVLLCPLPLVVAGTLISTTWCWHVVWCVFVSGVTKSGSPGWENDGVWCALELTGNMCFVFFSLFDFYCFLHLFCFSVFRVSVFLLRVCHLFFMLVSC